nr:hypothetical protein [Tanacetum cinerariifolium]
MLNKDNYVPWSSRIIRYARSRPNGKMIVDSIENGPYTDIKRIDADDQAIQTILLGLPEDVYAANGRIQGAQNSVVQSGGNQNGLVVVPRIANQSGTGNIVAARAEGTGNGDLDEIEEVNANCILMANLQQASTSSTQHDKAPVYDTDGSAEVHLNDNCYDNEIFNMFTQEEQYTNLLEPIPEPQLVPQNDNHVTSVVLSMVQSGGIVETSTALNKEISAHQETVYRNLVDQVAQVDMVNRN